MTGLLKRLPMYLFHRGLGLNVVREEVLEKCFFFFFGNFEMEIFVWVTRTGPFKRLSTYPSYRGLGPNVVRMRFFEILSFSMTKR